MINRCMRSCSKSLATRETRARGARRCHFTHSRTAPANVTDNTERWRGGGGTATLRQCCSWKWKALQSLWETVWPFLKMLNMELSYFPVIFFLEIIYPREIKTHVHGKPCTQIFITVLPFIAKK